MAGHGTALLDLPGPRPCRLGGQETAQTRRLPQPASAGLSRGLIYIRHLAGPGSRAGGRADLVYPVGSDPFHAILI